MDKDAHKKGIEAAFNALDGFGYQPVGKEIEATIKMRSALYDALARNTGISFEVMDGRFVEDVLKTYILAQVESTDLITHCEGDSQPIESKQDERDTGRDC